MTSNSKRPDSDQVEIQDSKATSVDPIVMRHKDRPWSEYPIGTKAHAFNGGHWVRVEHGWKWFNGNIFPTPGGDAFGKCVEMRLDKA